MSTITQNKEKQSVAALVTKEALEEFKQIWKKENGYELTDEKAMEEAIALLTLFKAIYRPLKKEWVEEGIGKV